MSESNIDQKITSVMSNLFGIESSEINANASPETIQAWDSVGHMNLVSALEEEFGLMLTDDQVINMKNYKLVRLMVEEALSLK